MSRLGWVRLCNTNSLLFTLLSSYETVEPAESIRGRNFSCVTNVFHQERIFICNEKGGCNAMTRALFIGGIVLALLLAACGRTTNAGGGNAGSTATTTAATATTKATATAIASTKNGCPSQQAPTTPLPAASTVKTQGGASPAQITLNINQTVEIHLPGTFRWGGGPNDPNHILGVTAHEGWFDQASHNCIWRYTAAKAGTATMIFSGTFLCDAGKPCPAIATVAEYDITVH
jgi:hypothetical protein